MNPPVPPKFTKRDNRRAVQQRKLKIRCRLQELLDAQDLTRMALSEQTGLTSAAIRGLCDNTAKRYDVDTIAVLCEFFGRGMEDLFELVPRQKGECCKACWSACAKNCSRWLGAASPKDL